MLRSTARTKRQTRLRRLKRQTDLPQKYSQTRHYYQYHQRAHQTHQCHHSFLLQTRSLRRQAFAQALVALVLPLSPTPQISSLPRSYFHDLA